MIFKVMKYSSALKDISNEVKGTVWKGKWEEVPDEDLWEDGELGAIDVSQKLFQRIVNTGEWKIIKEIK